MERGDHEQFIVHQIRDAIVAFESVRFPGHFVKISSNREPATLVNIGAPEITNYSIQFVIRVKVYTSPLIWLLSTPLI